MRLPRRVGIGCDGGTGGTSFRALNPYNSKRRFHSDKLVRSIFARRHADATLPSSSANGSTLSRWRASFSAGSFA
jgi:hypothetical protein